MPANDNSLELAFAVISLSVLGAVAATADRVSILPPSLAQWLEIGAALGLSCSANGVLALLVRRHGSVLVLGLCGLLLVLMAFTFFYGADRRFTSAVLTLR